MWQPRYHPSFVLPPKQAAVFRLAAWSLSRIVGDKDDDDGGWPALGIGVLDDLARMILDALDEPYHWIGVEDLQLWADSVELLRTEILDDEDHDMHGQLMDLPAQDMAKLPDYFIATVEDPSPERLEQIRDELRTLLAGTA